MWEEEWYGVTYLQSLHLSDDLVTLIVAALRHKHIHLCKPCRPLCNTRFMTSLKLHGACDYITFNTTSYLFTLHHIYLHYITLCHTYYIIITHCRSSLTPEVVSYEEHCTLSDDAAHWVRVLDIAHEQLMFVEHPRGRMGHLVWPHKPGAMEPRVITDGEGEGEEGMSVWGRR